MTMKNHMQDKSKNPIIEIGKDLYRIKIPIKGSPLRTTNSYLIRGDDRNLLIDTGYNAEVSIDTIRSSMEKLGAKPENTDILLTHFHDDHAGASTSLVHPSRKIYVPAQEFQFFRIGVDPGYYKECRRDRYTSEGVSDIYFEEIMNFRRQGAKGPDFYSNRFEPVEDKQKITAGDYQLMAIHTPGHTPGHMCYWNAKYKIMFTGDHILFDVSSNIIPWPGIPNVLGIYLYSLRKLQEYPVALALPGHREPGDLLSRIGEQLEHHERRLNECESIVKLYPNKNAFEITELMAWKVHNEDGTTGIPLASMRYAFGECLSHLDHLRFMKRISRTVKDGTYVYY